jgi:hypothetical protein
LIAKTYLQSSKIWYDECVLRGTAPQKMKTSNLWENKMTKVYYIITLGDGTNKKTKNFNTARKFFLNGFSVVEIKEVEIDTDYNHISMCVTTPMIQFWRK